MGLPPSIIELFNRASQAHQAGRLQQAEELYQQVLTLAPSHAEAHHRLGLIYSQHQQHAQAVRHLRRAIALDRHNPLYHNNLGEVWRRQGKPTKAIESYRQALALAPTLAEAHYNLANVLKAEERPGEAIHHYHQAIRLKPTHAKAHYNLGNTFREQGQFEPAAAAYRQAIRLQPTLAEAHNNLGVILREAERLDEAIGCYHHALQLQPHFSEAQRNLGLALERQGQIEAAHQIYRQMLDREPDNHLLRLHADTLFPAIAPDNPAIDRYRANLAATIDHYRTRDMGVDLSLPEKLGHEPPFGLIYQGRDDRALKTQWAELFQPYFPAAEPHRKKRGKPHIGFVVTRGHEGVFLKGMRGILNHLSAERFDLSLVCSGQRGEQVLRPAIANPAIRFLPLPERFDRAIDLLYQARFDLLYYWEIGTDAANYFLPFCRPAPVQCLSWGWPVTTGIPQVDYFISGTLLETEESDSHYIETLIRLERLPTYYYRPSVPDNLRPRSYFGLTDRQHLYLCPQNLRKVHPDFDPLAAEILRRDPQGLLFFIEDKQPAITGLLRQRFQHNMPDLLKRIRFLPRMSEPEYLNLLALTDVVIDTLHYSGGANTTYDALAAGTPVVTWPTQFHRGRYTYAAYRQMDFLDCVADSPETYVETALGLGTDPAYRADISAAIRAACPVLFEDMQAVTELADFFEVVVEHG